MSEAINEGMTFGQAIEAMKAGKKVTRSGWNGKGMYLMSEAINEGMTFGQAIEAMKHGKKVARAGWNGKGMYIWLMPGSVVHRRGDITDPHLKEINDASGNDTITFGPSARMRAADGSVVTGWLASQTDMFAEDWAVVE